MCNVTQINKINLYVFRETMVTQKKKKYSERAEVESETNEVVSLISMYIYFTIVNTKRYKIYQNILLCCILARHSHSLLLF